MYSCNFLTQKITKTPPNHLYFSLPVILPMFRRQRCPMSNCSKPKLLQKSRKHIQPLRGAQRHERTIQKYKNSVPGCTFIVHEMSAYCLFVVSALSLLMILFVFFPLLCCHLDSFGSQGSALVYFPYSTAGLGLDAANTIQNQISREPGEVLPHLQGGQDTRASNEGSSRRFHNHGEAPKSDYYSASTFRTLC